MDTIYKHSAGGIVFSEGKVLTIKTAKPETVSFPRGKIEEGESIEETAIREVKEETGYDAHIITPVGVDEYEFNMDENHYCWKVTLFMMALDDKKQQPIPNRQAYEEAAGFENLWLTIDDAKKMLTYQGSKDLLDKALSIVEAENIVF